MRELIWVFIGGGLGSICRYAIYYLLKNTNAYLPWPTLVANAIGSLLIGFFADQLIKNGSVSSPNALFWITGFCGGLTTFSAFALENVKLFRLSDSLSLILYSAMTYFLCLALVLVGAYLSKTIY